MSETTGRAARGWRPLGEAGSAAAGMCLFALFIHRGPPLILISAFGLLVTAAAVYRSLQQESLPAVTFGLSVVSRRIAVFTVMGCMLGLALGIAYRWQYASSLLPVVFGRFVPVAVLIGSTEELIYRGHIQGCGRRLGPVRAVVLAALCHTAYKCALFVFPPFAAEVNIGLLAIFTFLGGLAFGAIRELSGSVLPPVVAHACFDIIAYAERAQAPWWVWS